ncbi:MAG: orotidine-5'-phosphate decarboxylase [bacterium]|nr:orotidine-5'-phosphate decarboxylase [bacterium]
MDGFDLSTDSSKLELELRIRLNTISPYIGYAKFGMELYFSTYGQFDVFKLLNSYGINIFLDLKIFDIPETIKNASRVLAAKPGVNIFNLHATGQIEMMKAALEGAEDASQRLGIPRPKIIAVTVLTSMKAEKGQVLKLALDAVSAGMDGIVCSALDLEEIKPELPDDFIYVTPGIRMIGGNAGDQKRIATPDFAYKAGSTLQVIGRPIYEDLDTNGQLYAVRKISDLIQSVM